MIVAPLPDNELQRLADLYEYSILDTIAEKDYDDITHIAADICGMPISLISLIDQNRQWFKSRVGLADEETARDLAFCAHTILTPDEIFIVNDSSKDDRFHDNPLVTAGPHIGFYAGVPLVNSAGNALGSLCVIDIKPNNLTKEQESTLKALARLVVSYLDIRRKTKQLAEQKAALEQVNGDLKRFAHVVAHDIKSPCSSLAMGAEFLIANYGQTLDEDARELLLMMKDTSRTAIKMVDGILLHTQTVNTAAPAREKFTFSTLITDLKKVLDVPSGFTLRVVNGEQSIYSSRFMLLQVLLNLCTNAIKYNDKEVGEITVAVSQLPAGYKFSVTDNGRGIAAKDQERIFDLFSTLDSPDRFNKTGTGIGLSTVKRVVEKMGGEIRVYSEIGQGSTFEFTVNS